MITIICRQKKKRNNSLKKSSYVKFIQFFVNFNSGFNGIHQFIKNLKKILENKIQ